MLKPLSEGEELTLQGGMFHKLTRTGVLPPPGEKHMSSCALCLLPEATPLLQGSKDISKQVSLKDIKSLFYQATFGTKDQNQAYVKITSNVWFREKSKAQWKQSFFLRLKAMFAAWL